MSVMLYVVGCSVNVSVCFVRCVLDSVCELFGVSGDWVKGLDQGRERWGFVMSV